MGTKHMAMKKYLIVFKSKHGTARELAGELQTRLGAGDADLVELKRGVRVDPSGYETVIVGGSVYMGNVQKRVRKFLKKHRPALLERRLGLFLSYMDTEHGREEFDKVYDAELRAHAVAHGLFGGEFRFDEMNRLEKFLVKKASGITESVSRIDRKAIDEFAEAMRAPAS